MVQYTLLYLYNAKNILSYSIHSHFDLIISTYIYIHTLVITVIAVSSKTA